MRPTNPRLADLPDYPFDRLRALLDGIEPPAGLAPISLALGEPQKPAPAWLTEVVAANDTHWNRYPPAAGSAELRAAISDWLRRRYGLGEHDIDADDNVIACAGTREALYLFAEWLVPAEKAGGRPQVAMPNPFYHVYGTGALASGAEPLYLPATRETGFLPDLGALDAATLDRLALVFLCTPANPQGVVADAAYLETAIRLARAHDFVLAVDECYAEVYRGDPPPGALQVCRAMGEGFANVVVFHSLSKRSSAAGLRSGFVAGDASLIAPFRRFRSYIAATTPLPLDAAAAALWRDEVHVAEVRAFYAANVDVAARVIGERFGFYRPPGGFFLWLDVGDGEAAARTLWQAAAVRVLPGAHTARTGPDGVNPGAPYIRIALVHDAATTEEALTRLVKVL